MIEMGGSNHRLYRVYPAGAGEDQNLARSLSCRAGVGKQTGPLRALDPFSVLQIRFVWIPRRCDILTTTLIGPAPPGPDPTNHVTGIAAARPAAGRSVTMSHAHVLFVTRQFFLPMTLKNETPG